MATTYAPELVNTVLRGLRSQMLDDGWISELELQFAGPSPSEPVFDLKDESATQWADEFNDHTGAQLPGNLVHAGKMEEIRWVKEIGLYKKISRAEAKRRGAAVVPIKWVVTDKGDANRPKVRRRLVGRELRARTKGTLLAHEELFSAMLPWEIFKVLLGLLVSDNVPGAEGEELEMAIFDISGAHFMAPMDREACIELPQEDKLPEDGDAVGLLQRSMYGFRTASANWMRDWQATLEEGGYKVGVANPALFHRSEDGSRGGVHGDDFAVVGSRRALNRMGKTLSSKYSMRESHRLGFGSHCERHAELLNRIVSDGTDSDGRRYVRIEPDIRPAELVLRNLGLEGSKAKPLTTPGFKVDEKGTCIKRKRGSVGFSRCYEV